MENSAGDQSPVRDVMWRRKHFVPDGTRKKGERFFYQHNVPDGTKNNIFYTPAGEDSRVQHPIIILYYVSRNRESFIKKQTFSENISGFRKI
jgi:enterochelin esterase-like enzyme